MGKTDQHQEDFDLAFCKKLEVIALGCHTHVKGKIKNIFYKHKISTFQFVEFFLETPVSKKSKIPENKIKTYCPFLIRLVNENPFIIEPYERDKIKIILKSKTRKNLGEIKKKLRTHIPISEQKLGKMIYEEWKRNRSQSTPEIIYEKYIFSLTSNDDLIKVLDNIQEHVSNEYLAKLWTLTIISPENPLVIIKYPIATKTTFLGYFLIGFQKNEKCVIEAELIKELLNLAEQTYIPTLILFHLSQWEFYLRKDFKKEIEKAIKDEIEEKENKKKDSQNTTRDNYPSTKLMGEIFTKLKQVKLLKGISWIEDDQADSLIDKKTGMLNDKLWHDYIKENSLIDFEAVFGRLWLSRNIKWNGILETKLTKGNFKSQIDQFRDLLKAFYFAKYNMASPGMIKQFKTLITGTKQMSLPEDGDSLPCALVFGEAGSGKDIMARLIPLFTREYWDKQVRTINMAALKPNILAIPMLFGIENKSPGISIQGLISKDHSKDHSEKATIILDELNSLDIDLQGSLLRILENGEAQPLFDIAPPKAVKNLIIGIVNEDPEIVSREKELIDLKNAEGLLGKALNTHLYENFNKAKRLRPDLMYRLKRNLYIRIPPLRDRREDIPIIFNYKVGADLESIAKAEGFEKIKYDIEMDVFDMLIRPDFNWPGNVRQLEAVAKQVAVEVFEKWSVNEHPNEDILVDYKAVKSVLKDHFEVIKMELVEND